MSTFEDKFEKLSGANICTTISSARKQFAGEDNVLEAIFIRK